VQCGVLSRVRPVLKAINVYPAAAMLAGKRTVNIHPPVIVQADPKVAMTDMFRHINMMNM
jgi:hypothetical protein